MARRSGVSRSFGPAVLAVVIVGMLAAACTEDGSDRAVPETTVPSTDSSVATCDGAGEMTTIAYDTVAGVAPNLLSLDVYPIEGSCSAPVVMWVHGGGYQVGDKRNQVADKVELFNARGWVFVSVNYRLTRPGDPDSAQYPDHFDDVAAAVAWVHAEIGRYGGDPSEIALLGHSAGADIVSNVATNPDHLAAHDLELSDLRCAGPLDTEGFDKRAAGADEPDGEADQWQAALGNEPDYLDSTSATELVAPDLGIPPMIGVVRGTARRQAIQSAFLEALEASGIAATSIDARSLSHAEVNRNIGAPDDTVMTAPLVAFLADCFAAG